MNKSEEILKHYQFKNETELVKELESVFNRLCIDSELNIPDFMIAEHVLTILLDMKLLMIERDKWFNFKPFVSPTIERRG